MQLQLGQLDEADLRRDEKTFFFIKEFWEFSGKKQISAQAEHICF